MNPPSSYSNLINKLGRVDNSRNLKEFLENHIHWRVGIYNFENSDVFVKNDTNTSSNLIFSRICASCDNPENDDENNDGLLLFHLGYYSIVILVLGLVSLVGNGTTAFHEMKICCKQKATEAKERKVYNILVLNLCISDSLMGLYLTLGPIVLTVSGRKNITPTLCNAFGIMNVLSMQASASILVIITAYRLFGVLYPFKRIHIKATVALLILVWLSWLFILALPFFNEILFAHEFTQEIFLTRNNGMRKSIHFPRFIRNVQNLAHSIKSSNDLFSQVLDSVSKYKSNEVAVQLLGSFNLVDFERDETSFFNYYFPRSGCSIYTLVDARNQNAITYFSLFLIIFNLVEYVFILIAYLIMFKKISPIRFQNLFACLSQKCYLKARDQQTAKMQNENRQVYLRIFAVVITDLFCGIPISLFGLAYYFESLAVPNCFRNHSFYNAALLLTILLFPLNSIINPYIYSYHLWKSFFKRCKKRLLDHNSSKVISASTQISM